MVLISDSLLLSLLLKVKNLIKLIVFQIEQKKPVYQFYHYHLKFTYKRTHKGVLLVYASLDCSAFLNHLINFDLIKCDLILDQWLIIRAWVKNHDSSKDDQYFYNSTCRIVKFYVKNI